MSTMEEILVLITVDFREEMLERVRALSPRLKVVLHPTESLEDFPKDLLPDVEILYTSIVLPDPEDVPKLKWVQSDYAGIDHIAGHSIVNSEVEVTTLSGVTASVITGSCESGWMVCGPVPGIENSMVSAPLEALA